MSTSTRRLVAAAALWLAPGAALACSPPRPGAYGAVPADGETWPANAAVFLDGDGLSLENLRVTVDGAAARLERAENVHGFAAFVLPVPDEGAEVVIDGDPCAEADDCDDFHLTYTAGRRLDAGPPQPTGLDFDVWDHADVPDEPGLCSPGGDLTYYVRVQLPLAPPPGPQTFVRLESALNGGPWQGFGWREPAPETPFEVTVRTRGDETRCFRALVVDAAGHESPPTAPVCEPCHARTDPPGAEVPPWAPPDAPAFTDDERAGGPCLGALPDGGLWPDAQVEPPTDAGDDEPDGSGFESNGRSGCTAAVGRPAARPGWVLVSALVGLGLAVKTRGRRGRSR